MPSNPSAIAPPSHGRLALTEPQRRIITTSLRCVEERLLTCRRLVRGEEGRNARFVTMRDQYTAGRAEELALLIDGLLDAVYALGDRIGAVPQRRSTKRSVSAQLSSAWEMLEDLRPKRLKGYGTVDPATAPELESFVQATTECVRRILDAARATDSFASR